MLTDWKWTKPKIQNCFPKLVSIMLLIGGQDATAPPSDPYSSRISNDISRTSIVEDISASLLLKGSENMAAMIVWTGPF